MSPPQKFLRNRTTNFVDSVSSELESISVNVSSILAACKKVLHVIETLLYYMLFESVITMTLVTQETS